jgi:ribonucleoside-diphosphate reductase alpha chain
MQAALQQYVDSAISKTVTVPSATAFEEFSSIYQQAHRLGLKGCTAYRPGIPRGSVLQPAAGHAVGPHCCDKHLAQRPQPGCTPGRGRYERCCTTTSWSR